MAEVLTDGLGRPVRLELDERGSGPLPGEPDPFAGGEVDLGVVCAPTLARLGRGPQASVSLVPTAFDLGISSFAALRLCATLLWGS